ncbi:hypothetical protein [Oceaniradius stylonematis]|uniref:hypothetical protein n=1 Tax=Oceaniradius stylonematis TaxID=2184161 RepID=UPI001FDECBDA|nr:hypothetical protein [Oceaniradius stylonematis]
MTVIYMYAVRSAISSPLKNMGDIWYCVLKERILRAILRVCSQNRLDIIMNIPVWTKPAFMGAAAGAAALAIIGFGWGGWVTEGTAMEMSNKQSMAATATALTPYCVQKSRNDPDATGLMVEINDASRFQRRGIVEKAGWATPLGADKPDRALAEACLIALTSDT